MEKILFLCSGELIVSLWKLTINVLQIYFSLLLKTSFNNFFLKNIFESDLEKIGYMVNLPGS